MSALLRLLLAVTVPGGAVTVTRWGRARSAAALLRHGDFTHVARSFRADAAVLHISRHQRCVVVREGNAALAREVCGSRDLADRVGDGARAPGLTRQRDGDAQCPGNPFNFAST